MTSVFALPADLSAKTAPALLEADERHFARVAEALDVALHDLALQREEQRRLPGGHGTAALERDQEIRRLTSRAAHLSRYSLDVCLGRMVPNDGTAPLYVGRLGLADAEGQRLLLDWRSPAAAPFFAATHAQPHGLASRRRYRWSGGRIVDYWDEAFTPEALDEPLALDDDSAFVASLASSRSTRMRDVLATIAADQDAIIRADSRGTLVVDGGPGTGKTVVALHRAAYLLHADPRLGEGKGGILVVGPHEPYVAYVSDVLPSLGEDSVQTCTLADFVSDLLPEADTPSEVDPEVAALKADARMISAVEAAVAVYEEPPTDGLLVETPHADVWVSAEDWAEAFAIPAAGSAHNEARDEVREALLDILLDKLRSDEPEGEQSLAEVRAALAHNAELIEVLHRNWPLLDPHELVGDLWAVPAYLRHSAPWLNAEQARTLRRREEEPLTTSDLPLLDAARRRLGSRERAAQRRRAAAEAAAHRAEMDDVVSHLIEADDSDLQVMSMLRGDDLRGALTPEGDGFTGEHPLEGPFAHIVVDEAQELSDAAWQMLLARCPSRSFTVVGDRAQARLGFTESWADRLTRVGLDHIEVSTLSVNYRTPTEVMAVAQPEITSVLPDANVPTSIRDSGIPVRWGEASKVDDVVAAWLTTHPDGVGCVIATTMERDFGARVRTLTPQRAKGLEFDLVVLVNPGSFGDGVAGAVDRYVAMTRATQELVVLGT